MKCNAPYLWVFILKRESYPLSLFNARKTDEFQTLTQPTN
jgi:hypothetical protein